MDHPEEPLLGGGRTDVHRRGDAVLRAPGPWSSSVVGLLKYLEQAGFSGAPRVIGAGFADDGREALQYVEGWSAHPGAWPDDVLPAIGSCLRELHHAAGSYVPPADAYWQPWFGRALGDPKSHLLSHCDTGPWNLLRKEDGSIALIDWESAGPVDPLVELAQACWLNAQLHGDVVARRHHLPEPRVRARQARLLLDGYGDLTASDRARVVELMSDVALADAAAQTDEVVADDETGPLWPAAWRIQAAAWMRRHRSVLNDVIVR